MMRFRKAVAILAATGLVLGLTGVAGADNVQSSTAADVLSSTGQLILTAGGAGKIVSYEVQNNGTGSDAGAGNCDVSSTVPMTLTISGLPTGVSATPSSLNFTSCNAEQSVTYAAASNASPSVNAFEPTLQANAPTTSPAADFNVNPAKVQIRVVAGDVTAPGISYALNPSAAQGAGGWYTSNVGLTWTVTESESPASLVKTGCVDQSITTDQIAQTYSCSATSTGGTAETVSVTIKRDAAAPTVDLVGGPTSGTSYYEGEVPGAPSCTASDATSGVNGVCTVSGYGTAVGTHTVTASATDRAGNSGTSSALTYTVLDDITPPDISATFDPATPNGDGGWYTSNVSLTWSVFEGETPGSVSTTGCVDQNVTADQQDTTYSCSASSLGGPAGPVTRSIKRDATPPTVTLDADAFQASHYEGEVPPMPTCEAEDLGSGVNGDCLITGYDTSIGEHTVVATASDIAGNEGESSEITYTVLDDLTPPVVTVSVDPADPDGENGWYRSDVTVTWTVTEDETPTSLDVNGCVDQEITADQVEMQYSCSATSLGGPAAGETVSIKRDAAVPTVSGSTSPVDGANGWHITAPTVSFDCDDVTSGVSSCNVDGHATSSISLADGPDQSVSGTATDRAGNTASSTVTGVDVDTVNPLISISSSTSTTASSMAIEGTYSDATSGVLGVTVNNTAASLLAGSFARQNVALQCGANTVTAVATDAAGRTGTDSASIYRQCFTATFQQPLDGNGVLNKAKLGRVVPVKLTIGANSGTVPTPVYYGLRSTPCATGTGTDEIESYAAGSSNVGNTFRLTDGAWMYNLDTSKLPGATINSCYQLDVYVGGTVNGSGIASGGVPLQNGSVRIQLTK